MGSPLLVLCVFCLVFISACSLFVVFFRWSWFSELKNTRGDVDQVAEVCNRRASPFLLMATLESVSFSLGKNVMCSTYSVSMRFARWCVGRDPCLSPRYIV